MRTYLVTGGAGFIGSNYIHYMFKKYGDTIRIIIEMLKASFENFVSKLNSIGVEEFEVRCQGGNRTIYNNASDDPDMSGKIVVEDENNILAIEVQRATNKNERTFNITQLGFDNIDSILTHDMTRDEAKKFIKALGAWDDSFDTYFNAIPNKVDIIPGTAGLRVLQDKNGVDILPPHSVGMITYGVQPTEDKSKSTGGKTPKNP